MPGQDVEVDGNLFKWELILLTFMTPIDFYWCYSGATVIAIITHMVASFTWLIVIIQLTTHHTSSTHPSILKGPHGVGLDRDILVFCCFCCWKTKKLKPESG